MATRYARRRIQASIKDAFRQRLVFAAGAVMVTVPTLSSRAGVLTHGVSPRLRRLLYRAFYLQPIARYAKRQARQYALPSFGGRHAL